MNIIAILSYIPRDTQMYMAMLERVLLGTDQGATPVEYALATFMAFRKRLGLYFRTKCFNLNMRNYLTRDMSGDLS
jgi:hypothetical protein